MGEISQSYYNGHSDGCPIINTLDPDESCKSSMRIFKGACAGYCEVRNYYFYGQEVPFQPLSNCRANEPCSIQASQSATLTQTFEFNVGAGLNTKRSVKGSEFWPRSETETPQDILKCAFNIVRTIADVAVTNRLM